MLGFDSVRISSKQLEKSGRFMAFTPSAFAVTPTVNYNGKYLNERRILYLAIRSPLASCCRYAL